MVNVSRSWSTAVTLSRPLLLITTQPNQIAFSVARSSSYTAEENVKNYGKRYNYLWAPGPYPMTPEERRAAAKKYNMIEEDYEPYPCGEYGDYPKLKPASGESREFKDDWDYGMRHSNYGETLDLQHLAHEATIGIDDTSRRSCPLWVEALACSLMLGTVIALFYATKDWRQCPPLAEHQYPDRKEQRDRKHYTFELVDE